MFPPQGPEWIIDKQKMLKRSLQNSAWFKSQRDNKNDSINLAFYLIEEDSCLIANKDE